MVRQRCHLDHRRPERHLRSRILIPQFTHRYKAGIASEEGELGRGVGFTRRTEPQRLSRLGDRDDTCLPSSSGDRSRVMHAGMFEPPAAGDSRGRRYSRGGALPPWPVHRSAQMVESRSMVVAGIRPQPAQRGPTTSARTCPHRKDGALQPPPILKRPAFPNSSSGQAGIGHQAMVVKSADTVGFVLWQHLLGAPCFRAGFWNIIDSEEHSSRTVPKAVLRWIRANG